MSLYTDTVDGINFKSDNLTLDSHGLTSGCVRQTVKLVGYGTPIGYSNKKMTIYSTSVSFSATCQVSVLIGYNYMKLYSTGSEVYNA